ncbi:hypothetical protein F5X68DRAFT_270377 [Plectosphaerella plurivora]|uniref:Uncharacterized protein n=1 Tax=Plectosphaerella plurivora TaxID=936078 RepID=A0A9P9A981_9PEZI|nr:hypothetical protein F5X68DRAFT_270377 [Plectosphaerella plurivora]
MFRSLPLLALGAPLGSSACLPKQCFSPQGDIDIPSFQLYPENAASDPQRCVVYFSVLYNATVAVYDPKQNAVIDTIEIDGLSGDPLLHSSGVKVGPQDTLSIIIDAGAAFDTGGQDVSGDNFVVKYSLQDNRELWRVNLTAVTDGVYSGFQDIEHDDAGNTYALGTFPSSIIRVSADGQTATPWYLATPPDHTIHGYSGIVRVGDYLIVSDNADGQLYRFDTRSDKGVPEKVVIGADFLPEAPIGLNLDGSLLPARYEDKVMLVTDNVNGTIVLRSADGWATAEVVGTVPGTKGAEGAASVQTVQIGESIYSVNEFFADDKVAGTLAGDRSVFPLTDITAAVGSLLQ